MFGIQCTKIGEQGIVMVDGFLNVMREIVHTTEEYVHWLVNS